MSSNPKAKEAVEWYLENRSKYEALAEKTKSILKELLEAEGVNYYSVESRAKTVESYEVKASKPEYTDPRSEITDMAGVRVITYTDLDAKKAAKLIRKAFEVHPQHTVDKTQELGTDRVGYRSIHCTGTLGKNRLCLPECTRFAEMSFEIQIRTILQHAWAEFEHDRNYKFSGVLPPELKRRLSVLAGSLELIDREFDAISSSIDAYVADVSSRTKTGDLQIPIDSKSLMAYMKDRFHPLVQKGLKQELSYTAIEQLLAAKIETLEDFEKIIPPDFIEKSIKLLRLQELNRDFSTIVWSLMVIHDTDGSLETTMKTFGKDAEKIPMYASEDFLAFYSEYGIDYLQLANKKGITIKILPS